MIWAVMMLFFPYKMFELYELKNLEGSATDFMTLIIGYWGIQHVVSAVMSATFNKKGASQAAQSAMCFGGMLSWGTFLFISLMDVVNPNEVMPQDGAVGNAAICFGVMVLQFTGWMASGKHIPSMGNMMPEGELSSPIAARLLLDGFFAAGLILMTSTFANMYVPGVLDTLPNASVVSPVILSIMMKIGVHIAVNIVTTLMVVGAEPANIDTKYRVLRAQTYANFLNLGTMARESLISKATGWDFPMYNISFVQFFAVTFYGAHTLGCHEVTVGKSKFQ